MKRTLAAVGVVLATALVPATQAATAGTTGHLSGGGTATISQVAFNIDIDGSGGASGSFECLMAGRSSFVLAQLGLAHIMKIHATPTAGSISGSTVTFSGPGKLIMDNDQHQAVEISVWANVATQMFHLTVVGGPPMPDETFLSGGISFR